ncbi:MAG: aminotransferase class I/II-fold pyridoxal phosphate-dependent enzyme [Acidobacteria bacterium]|nr:aminotransferase class I/II-fold pyridoxal phosphate-dependent enzyme [Acidobacteriota bacterium]
MTVDWISNRLKPYEASIFATIGKLAIEHGCVNFGQGFPDFDGPGMVKEAARSAISEALNQYAPLAGALPLRQALAQKYQQHGLDYDVNSEITVTNGATEAMYASIMAICNPGDEIVVFEPTYDTYNPIIEMCGGTPVPVRLHPPAFAFDPDELAQAFSKKTRAIIVNSPHNPTGRVFNRPELQIIRDLCVTHNAIAITDEVYEHLTFHEHEHIPLATLDNMRERTITISSSAKTFSLTGWKIGYALAPAEATEGIRRLHQFAAFAVATPLQMGIAHGIERIHTLLPGLVNRLARKRTTMCNRLEDMGFNVFRPQGTFFILADISPLTDMDDISFVRFLIESSVKVATIPVSVFYQDQATAPKNYIRFCFAKKTSTIDKGLMQMKALRSLL